MTSKLGHQRMGQNAGMKTKLLIGPAMACLLAACVSKQEEQSPRYGMIRPRPSGHDPRQAIDPYNRLQEPFSDLRESFLPPSVVFRAKSEQKIITVYMRDASTLWGFEKASWATNFAEVSRMAFKEMGIENRQIRIIKSDRIVQSQWKGSASSKPVVPVFPDPETPLVPGDIVIFVEPTGHY